MADFIRRFNKNLSRTVGGIVLTALLFSLSVTLEASARQGYQPGAGSGYAVALPSVLAESAAGLPSDNMEIPDFLVPRSGGFILPSPDELAQYTQNTGTGDESGDTPASGQPDETPSTEVPESEAVDDSYFADTVFIGDSRTVGLMTYSGVKSYYYAKVSLNIFSVLHTKFLTDSDGDMLTALETIEKYPIFKKVYICFGINELGYNPTSFINAYEYFTERVIELLPDATIYIQAILPVTAEVSAKNRYGVNNDAVVEFNTLLSELAQEKGLHYVNVYEEFAGTDGALDPDLTGDGIHLGKTGIERQMQYFRTHTIDDSATNTSD